MYPHPGSFAPETFLSALHTALPFAPLFLIIPVLIVLALWTLIIKGVALWHAARGSQKWWFVALLLINTAGVLEVVYLLWFRNHGALPVTTAPSPVASAPSDV